MPPAISCTVGEKKKFLYFYFGSDVPFGAPVHKTDFEIIFNAKIKCLRRSYSQRNNKKNMTFECRRAAASMGCAHDSHKRVEIQQLRVRVRKMHKIRINIFYISTLLLILNAFTVSTAECRPSRLTLLAVLRENGIKTLERRKKSANRNQRRLRRSDRADNHHIHDYVCSRRNKTFVIESFGVPFVAKKFVDSANGVCVCVSVWLGIAPCYFSCGWRLRSFH